MPIFDHLILGANGFIGRHVAAELARAGRSVVLAGRSEPKPFLLPDDAGQISFRRFDLADADWPALIADCAVVHHYAWSTIPQSAAQAPIADLQLNVGGTLGLLQAMAGRTGQRLVFTSSGGTVYGAIGSNPAREDDPVRPISAYGAAKLAAESYVRVFRASHGLDCRVARLSNPFGPGQEARNFGAVSSFTRKALSGEPIEIWGDGAIIRDYIYISDVAAALAALAEADVEAGVDLPVFNIGSSRGASLNDLVSILEGILGRRPQVRYSPSRRFDLPYNVLDTSRITAALGWSPQISLEDGIGRLVAELTRDVRPRAATC